LVVALLVGLVLLTCVEVRECRGLPQYRRLRAFQLCLYLVIVALLIIHFWHLSLLKGDYESRGDELKSTYQRGTDELASEKKKNLA